MRIPAPSFQDVPNARALPTPYASPAGATPDAFGADVGEAIQGAAQGFGEIYHREKRKADESAATAALAQGQTALTDIVDDPVKGYVSLKGMDALAGRDKALEDLDKRIAEINASLNPEQQRLFQHPATMLRNEAQHRIASHEAQQVNIADLANTKGAADAISRSLQTPAIASDPSAVATNMAKLQGVLESAARRQLGTGATPEALQSVIGPGMQRGAMDAMNGAMATENPDVAIGTFQRVSQYLGEHEHTYGNFVRGLATKQQVATESANLIAAGVTQVAMPDGTILPRVDGAKVAAKLATLPAETPNLAEIAKAADTKEKVLADLWNKSVDTVYARIYSAGQNPVTGEFDLQSPKIDPKDKAWLSQFAAGKLTDLKKIGDSSQRGDTAAIREESHQNLSVISADIHDEARWAEIYSKMTPAQFLAFASNPKYGLTGSDTLSAQRQFDSLRTRDNKLAEPIGATVKRVIGEAFPEDDITRKAFEQTYFEKLRAGGERFQRGELAAGRKVDTEAIEKFLNTQMQKVPSGHWYQPDKRLIQLTPETAPQPPPVAAATPVAPPPDRVRVIAPDGRHGSVPATRLDELLKQGYSRE